MKLKSIFILLCSVLVWGSLTFADQIPSRPQRVNDLANVLSSDQERVLTSYLTSVENTNGAQIVVLTVNSLDGRSIEGYSIDVVERWRLGQADKDNGVLLLVSKGDRELRIEVGYGLEGDLTDATCDYIIRNTIVPSFKQNRYGDGIVAGVRDIGSIILKETPAPVAQARRSTNSDQGGSLLIPFLIVLVVILKFVAIIIYPTGNTAVDIFLVLFIMSRGSNHRHRGGFGGGGGGGFSGGGGSFGGGGSSGSW